MPPTACPGSTQAGCRCPEHHEGLLAHARDRAAYQRALARLRPAVIRAVAPPADTPACDLTMTCPCPTCTAERAARIRQPPRRIRQPWDVAA